MLRDGGVELSTRIRRQVGLLGVVACVVGGAVVPAAQADRRPPQNPEELWRAYPLEQTPTTAAPAPASPPRRSATSTPSTSDTSTSDPPWALLAGIAIASALLVVAAWALRRRRREAAPRDGTRVSVPSPLVTPAVAPAARTTPTATPTATATAPAQANGRPAGRSKSPVCQIRWSRRGRWFFAVRIDTDGAEHRVGRSPRVDCDGLGPPGETPEARAALRQLVKDLRRGGWRPLRARGIDFGERRWYARRFRWPTEAEVLAANPDRPREVAGRPGSER
jgi:LPXTG-motif cell wall-anchored protein